MSIINFNKTAFFQKLGEWARLVGRATARPAILLCFVMSSENTPRADKILIFSALSYLVLPVDLIDARRLPVIGWMDEVVSLTVAYQKVCRHITPEMQRKADSLLDKWFPEYTPYELIDE